MIRTLADALSLQFSRIQFTPDLMPADITGTEVIQEDKSTGQREYRFLPGPVFANVILADEINRTPPKTQAALLEAMQERQVTVGGEKHVLPEPFFVLATQNPIEQEGPIRFRRRSWIVSCSTSGWTIRRKMRSWRSSNARRPIAMLITPMLSAEQILELTRIVPQGADCRSCGPLRFAAGAADAPERTGGSGFRPRVRDVGSGTTGQPIHGVGGQSPRRAGRAVFCQPRGYSGLGPARAEASHQSRISMRMRKGLAPDDIIQTIDRHRTRPWPNTRMQVEKSPKSLDPRTLAKLKGLHLRARHIVEGYVAGLHRSPYHGFSIEFAEHREYAPGDDLRYVDWKVFGRTDKFYLKQYRRRNESDLPTRAGCQRKHELSRADSAPLQVRIRTSVGGVTGLAGAAATGCDRFGDV